MKFEITLHEEDYLNNFLFFASISERIRKKRLRSRFTLPLIYGLIVIFCLTDDMTTLGVVFSAIGIAWYFTYPVWEKKRYIKHYTDFINENLKEQIGRKSTLEFDNDFIHAVDETSETRMMTREIEEIFEIPTHILVKLKSAQSFIIPKNTFGIDQIRSRLKEIASVLKINYSDHPDWQWQ